MPRITRKQQKIFAVNASNNGVFGSLQANDPVYSQDPDAIQGRTAYSNGWNDATYSAEKLPALEEFQGLQYLFSRQLSYLFQEGVAEWNTDTTYYVGSIVKSIDGNRTRMYISTIDNNNSNLPTDTTRWYCFFDSSLAYANVSLENLNSTGKNIGNWSSNLTNCLIDIPQDIKLELNNGTLTLKAGTKFYLPDGNQYQISTDTTVSAGGANEPYFIFGTVTGGTSVSLARAQVSICYSGSTQPSFVGAGIWFDTVNNVIKYSSDGGSTWSSSNWSLPLAICTPQSSAWVSIDQVFNGIGYIGGAVFVSPGVKGLIPNGRNADGTLNNSLTQTTALVIRNYTGTQKLFWGISGNNVYYQTQSSVNYDANTNTTNWQTAIVARGEVVSGVITQFDARLPVRLATTEMMDDLQSQLDSKANVNLSNISENIDYVVESYNSGTDWYRIYKSGWIEQGGVTSTSVNHEVVTFLKPFSNTNYSVIVGNMNTTANTSGVNVSSLACNLTTTTFQVSQANQSERYSTWRACGF